ncbi:MAG: hypothetical protein ACPGVG_14820 [Mycobacterium sp.]
MATFYSDLISSSNNSLVAGYRSSAGINHGRLRASTPHITAAPTTSDVVRMIDLKSSDRLLWLYLSSGGEASAGAVNIGLHKKGDANDGAVIDADLFSTAVVITAETGPTELFEESTTLESVDRGKQLWQLVGDGATYTEDPHEEWTITLTPTVTVNADTEISMITLYTAGD